MPAPCFGSGPPHSPDPTMATRLDLAPHALRRRRPHVRSYPTFLMAATIGALPYAILGPFWLREDWLFAADPVHRVTWWFEPFRPTAAAFHLLLFLTPLSPLDVLAAGAALTALCGWLFYRVAAQWFDERFAFTAAIVWTVSPFHTAMSWWASGLYITMAACLCLQSLRVDGRRGALWALAGGTCYEMLVLPVIVISAWRRQWWHVAAGLSALTWALAWHPMSSSSDLISIGSMLRGGFGLTIGVPVAIAVLCAALWRWRDRAVQVGLVLGFGGVLPVLRYKYEMTFAGLGDRGYAAAGFGIALVLAALAGVRWRRVLVCVLLGLTLSQSVAYGGAAAAVRRSLSCVGPNDEVGYAAYGPVQGLTAAWNMTPAVRMTLHRPNSQAQAVEPRC